MRFSHPRGAELVGQQKVHFGAARQEQAQFVQTEVTPFQRTDLEVLAVVPAFADKVQQGASAPFVFIPSVGDVPRRGVEAGDGHRGDGVGQAAEMEAVDPAFE